ncbi:hypothetical protein HAQ00_02235 [Acidithiobacillus caldus ATCC 51756]|uniref:TlpA family protein disulfide reductase n=1 Tax=Acidithiobacillus caldus TaxID=33059 RepID=UPI001C06F8FB|nr:hypothetical protein [Acidithiobacillus caldus]MBU2734563.1 hypothetical protein [Acidithiobacillus caldus ATCC 51756]
MLCVLLMPTLAAAQEGSFLTPGQIGPSCGSFLTPGALRACKKKLAEKKAEQKIQQRPQAQSLSARLKAFYQHYGKPPVAAAKALLDPTPQNIKAWALEEVRSQDNAAMVAAELTAEEKRIERKAEAVPTAELEAAKIPTIYADDMKVILWSRTNDCPECLAMTHTLQALAVENPSMIVQEELVGEDSLADAINFAAHSGLDFPVFPSNKKAALQRGIDSVPTIVLDDLEYHRSYVIRAPLNIASLRQGIMAFRNFNMRHPAKTGVR